MFKLVLEKAEEPEIKLPIPIGSSKKQESSRKKKSKRWEYQTTWSASWEMYMQVRKQQLERDTEQDGFQIGKGVRQGCILSPCLFNLYAEYIMRNAGLKKHKLESRLPGEISITSDMQMTPPLWQKVKRR